MPSGVDEVGVASMRLAHRPAQPVSGLRGQDQVHVIGHQTPGPDLDPGLARLFGQQVAVYLLVPILEEDRLAPFLLCRADGGGGGPRGMRGGGGVPTGSHGAEGLEPRCGRGAS